MLDGGIIIRFSGLKIPTCLDAGSVFLVCDVEAYPETVDKNWCLSKNGRNMLSNTYHDHIMGRIRRDAYRISLEGCFPWAKPLCY